MLNYEKDQQDVDLVLTFITEQNGLELFDFESATEAGVKEEITKIGLAFNDFARASHTEQSELLERLTWPIYGNYCGPGTNLTTAGQQIDWLDGQCRAHDYCYGDRGYGDCTCDKVFIDRLNEGLNKEYISTATAKTVAKAAIAFFTAAKLICVNH